MKKIFKYIILLCNFLKSYIDFIRKKPEEVRFELNWNDRYPCLYDNTNYTGFDRHYIYHPAWAARIIERTKPEMHIDISSTLYFSSILSAFVPVKFYDFRPANLYLPGLESLKADLLKLDFADNSIASLSCMHTVEHIGLGRYGDPIDYNGDIKAMSELARVLAQSGNLLFVVPIGSKSIIQFNAHRIYTKEQIVSLFNKFGLELIEFALIPEKDADGGLVINPSQDLLNNQTYGCGCFYFTKQSKNEN